MVAPVDPVGPRPVESRRRTNAALTALAAAAFVYVTAETLPVALLPQLSQGLHVSGGAVGLLVTVYAGIAGLTAMPLTAWSSTVPRRRLLTMAVGVLAVSQLGMAVAPDYATVMVARAMCAFTHGVFWAILAPVAAALEAPGRVGRATAVVFGGNSLALVLGTPLAAAVGAAVGWRAAVAIVGIAAALTGVTLMAVLPAMVPSPPSDNARDRLTPIPSPTRNRGLLVICAVTALVVTGHFTAYTYITRLIRHDAGLTGLALSAVLFAFGAAGIAGNALAGWGADLRPRQTVVAVVATLLAALVTLGALGPGSTLWAIVTIALWGAAFTAVPVCMQSGVLRVAPQQQETASALYVVAFQIGIGGGALLGSVLVDSGQFENLPFLAAALCAAGLTVLLGSRRAFPLPRPAPDGTDDLPLRTERQS